MFSVVMRYQIAFVILAICSFAAAAAGEGDLKRSQGKTDGKELLPCNCEDEPCFSMSYSYGYDGAGDSFKSKGDDCYGICCSDGRHHVDTDSKPHTSGSKAKPKSSKSKSKPKPEVKPKNGSKHRGSLSYPYTPKHSEPKPKTKPKKPSEHSVPKPKKESEHYTSMSYSMSYIYNAEGKPYVPINSSSYIYNAEGNSSVPIKKTPVTIASQSLSYSGGKLVNLSAALSYGLVTVLLGSAFMVVGIILRRVRSFNQTTDRSVPLTRDDSVWA